MTNTYINGTFSKSYFTASNNFDLKLSKSLCSNIEQWFIDCDDMQALPKNEKGKMLKVDTEKKDEIRFFLSTNIEYKGQKKIRDLFDNSSVFLNNYMKKHFDYVAPKIDEPKVEESKVEEENSTEEKVQTSTEIMNLAYSNLFSLMTKNNITMDMFYNHAVEIEDLNNINIEKVDVEKKLKTA